jgi:hypothetical protein
MSWIPCWMSTSSAESASISVVIGSNGAEGSVERCLSALAGQLDGVEVVVCEPVASDASVRSRFPFVHFLERRGALVPELWRDGIESARGDVVCLTISTMRPSSDWVAVARRLARTAAGAGGAIEPGDGLRARDWAEYFARYARDMLPFSERDSIELPGDNAVYTRLGLEAVRESYRHGFWEPDVNRDLAARGMRLVHSPALVVAQGQSAGFRAFLRQRLVHGRAYGRQRGSRFGVGRNAAGILVAPIVPLVLLVRTTREVFSRRRLRLRLVACSPFLLAYDVAWAVGEAAGHLDSLRRR